ncbi:MAG: MBL fold metallo-hydrolase [Phycisphaerales bacterium]|nr:MBL fold metallo-hydrolase [Phycisphaerales bacterium]
MTAPDPRSSPLFLFLGTGTSAGIPAIGCECAVCTSTDPRDQRMRTSAAILIPDPATPHPRTILLDTGPDLRQQSLRFGLKRCDAIVYTHNHVDHTFGLDEVRRFNAVQNSPIDIFADDHTLGFLKNVYRHIFDRRHNINDSFVASLIAHHIDPEAPFDVLGLRFTPIPLLHGRLPVLGFRIEESAPGHPDSPFPLAYCTDVSAIPTDSWRHFAGLRTLILDALRHRHHPTHLTLDQAITIAGRIGARQSFFVHMAHDLGHEATQVSLPDRMFLAHDGLVLG